MNKRTFDALLKGANKAELKKIAYCSMMEEILQPFFPSEIFILFQESDGFVVCYAGNKGDAPCNEPIEAVFENIKADKTYYIPL